MLGSCSLLVLNLHDYDRHDLQVIQNGPLRTGLNVKRRDKLSILNMHTKANLLSLELRRTLQLLNLMYMH